MPIETFIVSTAELAVLTASIASTTMQLDQAAQADLGVDEQQLGAAEQHLRERGLLMTTADAGPAIDPQLADVLTATMFPEQLIIVRTTLPNHDEPPRYFSFTGDRSVCNFVDAQGQHVFSVFGGVEDAINAIIDASGLPFDDARGATGVILPLNDLTSNMDALTLLMIINNPAQPKPAVRNLSWLVQNRSLWLVDPSQAAGQHARLIDRAALRETIVGTLKLVAAAHS